jgi:meso-butanediol dehydrogenase / (S,S)-butanediol dehydrogenase / diacetyl reductase
VEEDHRCEPHRSVYAHAGDNAIHDQERRSSIINIASLGSVRCLPAMPAYCTSKAGLIMLSQQAALDCGPQKIRANAVCLGAVKTAMVEKEFGQIGKMTGMDSASFRNMVSKTLPLQRFADPAEIGGVCTFLAGDDSSFMTGAALIIDAGTAIVDALGAEMMGAVRRYHEGH